MEPCEISCLKRVGSSPEHKIIALKDGLKVTMGRWSQSVVLLPADMISRNHAVLQQQGPDGSWTITDDKSVNGTRVNGTRLTPGVPTVLADGDFVQLGVQPVDKQPAEFVWIFHSRLPVKRLKLATDNRLTNQNSYAAERNNLTTNGSGFERNERDLVEGNDALRGGLSKQNRDWEGADLKSTQRGNENVSLIINRAGLNNGGLSVNCVKLCTRMAPRLGSGSLSQTTTRLNSPLVADRSNSFDSSLNDSTLLQLADEQWMERHEAESKKLEAERKEANRRLEEERKCEEANRKLEEERKLEEANRRLEEERKDREEANRRLEEERKNREEALRKVEEEKREREEALRRTEAEKREREEELKRQTERLERMQEELRAREEAQRKLEEEMKEKLNHFEENLRRNQEEREAERSRLAEEMRIAYETKMAALEAKMADRQRSEWTSLVEERQFVETSLQAELERQLGERDRALEARLSEEKRRLDEQLSAAEAERARLQAELMGARRETERVRTDTIAGMTEVLESELQCGICSEVFVKPTTLGCAHSFCAACIERWMRIKRKCPVCRARIDTHQHSIVLESYIDKVTEQLSDELKARRRALVQERNAEAAALVAEADAKKAAEAARLAEITRILEARRTALVAAATAQFLGGQGRGGARGGASGGRAARGVAASATGRGQAMGRGRVAVAPALLAALNTAEARAPPQGPANPPRAPPPGPAIAPRPPISAAAPMATRAGAAAVRLIIPAVAGRVGGLPAQIIPTAAGGPVPGTSGTVPAPPVVGAEVTVVSDGGSTPEAEEGSPDAEANSDNEDEYGFGYRRRGRRGRYYGGYGACYSCGREGHWANNCPYN